MVWEVGEYRDPVCGMRTDEDGPSVNHEGRTYYFCANTCKRAFEEEPEAYEDQSPKLTDHEHEHSGS